MNEWYSDQNYTFDQVVERIAKFKARHDCWHMMINTTRCVWDGTSPLFVPLIPMHGSFGWMWMIRQTHIRKMKNHYGIY
ncbi:hypothetical protein ACS0TY_024321 [Phlomoides rotata]